MARRVSCLGGQGGPRGQQVWGTLPSQGAAEAPAGPPRWAAGQAGLRDQPCGQSPCLACLLPALAGAGGHRGVPTEEAPGPERKGVPGPAGEGSGAESAEALPSRPLAPWGAGGSTEPGIVQCRQCQAQSHRCPQMAPVRGTHSGASFGNKDPTKRVTVLPGMGTVSRPAALNPARRGPRAMLGTIRERGREGRSWPGVGCQNPRERLQGAKKSQRRRALPFPSGQ